MASCVSGERAILPASRLTHLQRLEAEALHILREVVAECERPVTLYFDRQGQLGPAAPGTQSVLPCAAALSLSAHRYDVEVPGNDRVP